MTTARARAGLTYAYGSLYAFGSVQLTKSEQSADDCKTAESMPFACRRAWELLPGRMTEAVANTSPCEYNWRIFLFLNSGRSEVFDITAKRFEAGLSVSLDIGGGPVLCWRAGDFAMILTKTADAKVNLARRNAKCVVRGAIELSFVGMPVAYGGFVYWGNSATTCCKAGTRSGVSSIEEFENKQQWKKVVTESSMKVVVRD